ncbi:helix-turn-helix domain-containing protein [Frankia sp. QA3]|uniref:helix-turn-helix domain-containing protein n=1 Tax=Frankia sp. QA3 TaxID=710111 RepID=UPI0006842648
MTERRAELSGLVNGRDTPANVATRARIVLWHADGLPKRRIAALAGVSRPTVDLWIGRYEADGVSGLVDVVASAAG